MNKLITATLTTTALLLAGSATAQAAGGNGRSFCSNSEAPDGVMIVTDISTYSNAGEVVSAQAPLPGNRGSGWGVQYFCNPNINP